MHATREARDRIPEETRGMIQNTTRQRGLGMFKISPNFSVRVPRPAEDRPDRSLG